MTKQAAGFVTCNGGALTVIDESAITTRSVVVRCRCNRQFMIDVTPAIKMAIDDVTRGGLTLPEGDWRVVVNLGHSGVVLSAQLLLK